ncbi:MULTISPECIES: hypothetical protein [Chitinibacter]|jgi:uncharacterized membrane protein|uniref:hypothetical protein n=1 Tax=Chitinibacter TaxID=230666 RepID=UPI000646F2DF|nr:MULTISPECIES: hypothetical protein [Chitinibacter]
MDGLAQHFGAFFTSHPAGWLGALVLIVGYWLFSRILKMIISCVLLIAIAAGWYWWTHQQPTGSANAVTTVIENSDKH